MKSLRSLYDDHSGKVSDKWALYLHAYDDLFGSLRDKPLRMLEIGVQNGGALEIWPRYFERGTLFVGCDINPDCARLTYADSRVKLLLGDANSPEIIQRVVDLSPEFDLIIDDGSHTSIDVVRSFANYFPYLADDGLFVIEDMHCSYWMQFGGGLHHPYSAVTFFKHLVDVVNHEHWGIPAARTELLAGFQRAYGAQLAEELLAQVHSVTFANSLCLVRKRSASGNVLGQRIVAGSTSLVDGAPHEALNRTQVTPLQTENKFSRSVTPAEEADLENQSRAAEREADLAFQLKAERELKADLASQNSALESKLADARESAATTSAQLEELQRSSRILIDDMQAKLDAVSAHNSALDARLAQSAARLAVIESSILWRVTRPLRRLFHGLLKLRRPLPRAERLIWWTLTLQLPQRMREHRARDVNEALVKNSGLFDEAWYLKCNPDAANFSGGALRHFMLHGMTEGRNPNPFFDTDMYLAARPDVAVRGINPLVHYIRFGASEGTPPSDRFDPVWYRIANPDVAKAGVEPLAHFIVYGRKEGRKPLPDTPPRQRFVLPVTKAALTCLKASQPQTEMALFVTHAPGDDVKPHVLADVDALRREGIAVTLIIAADRRDSVRAGAVIDRVDGLYVRENVGFDFAAWAHVARHVDLSQTKILYLLNDSVVGPLNARAFAEIIARLRASPAQLVGLTDSHEDGTHHIQSYFLAAKGRAVEELADYLHGVTCLPTKDAVIRAYETRLLSYFHERGYQAEVLFPNMHPGNATTLRWRELIADGLPFVKISALRLSGDKDWRRPLAAAGWDIALVEKSLAIAGQGSPSAGDLDRAESGVKVFPIVPTYLSPAESSGAPVAVGNLTVAVHLHLYYSDMLEAFAERLRAIPVAFHLYVSVPDSRNDAEVAAFSEVLRERLPMARKIVLAKVPNRGRDLAPLIARFGRDLLGYDIVGHFHTKRSPHNSDLERWGDDILDLLLGPVGNGGGHVSRLFALLKDNAKIVYPEGNIRIPKEETGWGGNLSIAAEILRRYTNIPFDDFPKVEFSEGAMFWARSAAVRNFLKLPLSFADFPPEPIAPDGTLAHAVERLLFILAIPEEGVLIRLHKGDSIPDYQAYEDQQDYSGATSESDVKILAYYLPQFHPTPENDKWHGVGFTEWTKVRAANPLFVGHYQQHIPHEDIGYYILDTPDVLRQQADMMKKSGVYGQIFYHYWFSGRLILEHPAQMLLENADIDMPFCFCWANENWTRRWDGSESDVLLEQIYSAEDARAFIHYLIPFFRDSRYIRIAERPVLFVYRPILIPKAVDYVEIWAEECRAAGLTVPYVVANMTSSLEDMSHFGLDGAAERVLYDWTGGEIQPINSQLDFYKPVTGRVFSYAQMQDFYGQRPAVDDVDYFRSLVPNWDNTARYGTAAHALHGSTPALFQEWLEMLLLDTRQRLPVDRRFILVNAWNEWAEGAHLEPDARYGYAYLNAVGRALTGVAYSDAQEERAIARMAERTHQKGAVLMLTHRWGGGVDRHVNYLSKMLEQEGIPVLLARIDPQEVKELVIESFSDNGDIPLARFVIGGTPDRLREFLLRIHVRHLHVHHLAGMPEETADWIRQVCERADLPYDVTLHDYMAICPRITLSNRAGRYCGEPSPEHCDKCLGDNGSPFGPQSIGKWRQRYTRLLTGARRCFVPDQDVACRVSRYFPEVGFTVRPHPEWPHDMALLNKRADLISETAVNPQQQGRHVVVVGDIHPHKGSEVVLACARHAQKRNLPLRFTIVGTLKSKAEPLANITITGSYNEADLPDILDRLAPDIALFPSTCPETYSYVLTELLAMRIYPLAFDLGAPASRLRALGWGKLMPLAWMSDPAAIVDALLTTRIQPPSPQVFELAKGRPYVDILQSYYGLDWWLEHDLRLDTCRPDRTKTLGAMMGKEADSARAGVHGPSGVA